MTRTVWLVQTNGGWLSKRRYSYKAGTTQATDVGFNFARVFSRLQDAERACEKGDVVVEAKLVVKC